MTKAELAELLGVSAKTIQRKIVSLDERLVKRERGGAVLVHRDALQSPEFGNPIGALVESNEILRTSLRVVEDDNRRLRQEMLERELRESRAREAALRDELEKTKQERDRATKALVALAVDVGP